MARNKIIGVEVISIGGLLEMRGIRLVNYYPYRISNLYSRYEDEDEARRIWQLFGLFRERFEVEIAAD